MSTYEDNLLAARFASLRPEPLAGDWDDVLGRAGAARKGRARLRRSGTPRSRRRLVVVLAVVALVAVVTASALAVRAFILDRGFIGLPPLGATPSTPESGELEIFYRIASPGNPGNPAWVYGGSRAWVYADGRLIWLRDGADPPEAANRWSSGFLEQRLTPEGIELMRSEIVSTGLFAHDLDLVSDRARAPNTIELRNGDRSVRVRLEHACSDPNPGPFACSDATIATPEQVNALEQLAARLNDPAAWVPASAWADREIRAYVPSRFAVCYGWPGHPFEPSQLLTVLPAAVEDLLRARYEGTEDWSRGPYYCASVTSEEARTLDRALADAGLEGGTGAYRLHYGFKVPGPIREPADIHFEPYLPHGETTCSACG